MVEDHRDRPLTRDWFVGLMRVSVGMLTLAFLSGVGAIAWWQWLDPVLPNIEVAYSEIRMYPASATAHGGSRVYGVRRRLHVDRDFAGTIHPTFVRPDKSHILYMEGRPVMRDGTSHELSPVAATWTRGWHERERLWEVPANVPPGDYEYRVFIQVCNPLRCQRFHFAPLELRIE